MPRVATVAGTALVVYAVAVFELLRHPGGVALALPEPLGLLAGSVLGIILLLALPEWW